MTWDDAVQLTQLTCNPHGKSHNNSHSSPYFVGTGELCEFRWVGGVKAPPLPGCEHTPNHRRRLSERRREQMAGWTGPWPPHGSVAQKRARAHWARVIKRTGGVPCAYPDCTSGPGRTRRIIRPDSRWDIAHDDDQPGRFLGPACLRCNRGTKRRYGRKGNRVIPRSAIKTSNSKISKSQRRDLDRLKALAERDDQRRRRVILPSSKRDQTGVTA